MILTIILLIVSFSAYSVKETLQFHYSASIFKDLNPDFWNPAICWMNKYSGVTYKNGVPHYIPKFWGSTHVFVFVTDAPHLFQFISLNCWMLAMAINMPRFPVYINFIGIRLIYSIVFNSMFDRILIKK